MKLKRINPVLRFLILVSAGVALNTGISLLSRKLGIDLYLDSLGTALASMFGGMIPGVFTGFITNLIGFSLNSTKIFFSLVNVIMAIVIADLARKNVFEKFWKILVSAVAIAAFCAVLSSVITWLLYGLDFGDGVAAQLSEKIYATGAFSKFISLLISSFCTEGLQKFVSVLTAAIIYKLSDARFKNNVSTVSRRYGRPAENKKGFSLATKFAAIIVATQIMLGILAACVSFLIYRNISIRNHTEECRGVSEMAADYIDGNMVDNYLKEGRSAQGYKRTEQLLYGIKEAFPRVEYIYAYKIMPDGCHVVFDLDSGGIDGAEINSVIEFDESFKDKVDDLLMGKPIEPMVTDDTYGWLLTVYTPVYNSIGECTCYAAADIQMQRVKTDEIIFLAKMLSVFFSVSVIIIVIIRDIITHYVISPLNGMARAAGDFAFDIGQSLDEGVSGIKKLNISSKDEIGDLYASLLKMASDTSSHINEVEHQAAVIEQMQESIIMDFAEMVEARDKCTGDHIKKTSYYVAAIAEEMRREGMYPDILSEDYIAHLKRSAPLHDVGKIKVSDTILNKPGKLTEEEFAIMKTHTTEGESILKESMSFAQNEEYLKESADMATYHHEWWNGCGYPYGIKGQEIPLGARIMAVADVFDALVSRRSYKEPFSFDKAVSIIKEESGTHFDPDVVKAFLNICEQFRANLENQ
ncbi:MAG: HD domain-containing protein [Clostridia bacterium]|nr:HD domain-containing protein [Clostridia bacterium]